MGVFKPAASALSCYFAFLDDPEYPLGSHKLAAFR